MTNVHSRRHFLKAGLVLVPTVTVAAHHVLAPPAKGAASDNPGAADGSAYAPRFFTDAEWAFVQAATAQLIPEDDLGPSAADLGVPEFIDRQMETPYAEGALWYMHGPFLPDLGPELGYQQRFTPRDIYRLGIKGCDDWCLKTYGKRYPQLDPSLQVVVLKRLDENSVPMDGVGGALFFAQLLTNTKEGFFADPQYGGNVGMAGWKMLGFPGAQADFMDWIDHPNTPYPLGPVAIGGQRGEGR
ncbi:gluconate 2-dehydrogenase subunit 3 family protein [Pseudomonas sp. RIT-PI-S]|uniref:gluconate 2-dehydrogenase subunit 3 family protein n=1 Tax=Pseudomonas sp. RIT-PI-S TaxID=3035295 RepID=UPI0021D9D590|nr:gluconate 2-dehydrogenase subunit 3 family protein [Pseudomonas sp. RIT-PI-S]